MEPMKLDLHVHSSASDGAWSAEKLVRAAVAAGLDVLAVADHDTVAAVLPSMQAAAGSPLRVLSAVELTCAGPSGEMHLLGYGVDPLHDELVGHQERTVLRREDRMRGMIERLGRLGAHVGLDDVRREAGEDAVLGRPHLARALVTAGHVGSVNAAFERWLADAGPAWVGLEAVSAAEAIQLVHDAGGVAVWAHPRSDRLEEDLPALTADGLDGLEAFRPRSSGPEVERVRAVAARAELLVTGGSDWHGPWSGRLGDFWVRSADIAPFLERIAI